MSDRKTPFKASQKLLILRGVPGCGKSTFARELQTKDPSYKRVNRDDLRVMIDNNVWSKKNESFIRSIRNQIIVVFVQAGYNLVIDDTNIQPNVVQDLTRLARSCNPNITVDVITFDESLQTCLERNAKRDGVARVPEHVIKRMHAELGKVLMREAGVVQ